MLRGALIAAEESVDALIRFSLASFDAYWGKLLDVSDDDVILELHEQQTWQFPKTFFYGELRQTKVSKINYERIRMSLYAWWFWLAFNICKPGK